MVILRRQSEMLPRTKTSLAQSQGLVDSKKLMQSFLRDGLFAANVPILSTVSLNAQSKNYNM